MVPVAYQMLYRPYVSIDNMETLKYIRYKKGFGSATQIVIFTPVETHADMGRNLRLKPEDIVSAGFFTCDPESVETYGKSISLGLKSEEGDAEKIIKVIRGY